MMDKWITDSTSKKPELYYPYSFLYKKSQIYKIQSKTFIILSSSGPWTPLKDKPKTLEITNRY